MFDKEEYSDLKMSTDLMDKAFAQPLADLQTLQWKDFLTKYDHYTLKQWLIEYQNATHSKVSMTSLLLNFESMLDRSLSEMTINECDHGLSDDYEQIVGGFDLLPRSYLPFLEKEIIFKAKVTSISQTEKGVQVG